MGEASGSARRRARGAWLSALLLASCLFSSGAKATPILLRDSATAGFVGQAQDGPLDLPVVVGSYGEFVEVFSAATDGLDNPYLAPSVAAFFANGGQRLYVVRVAASDDATLIGNDGGAPGTRTGLQALLDVDEIAVVAIPGAVSSAVQAALIAHAEGATARMAILDPVAGDDLDAVVAQRAQMDSVHGHAALYFPWVQAAPSGEPLILPPSGFVAGVFARTEPPDAPTGEVVSATGVTFAVNSAQQDLLNALGIDTIRYSVGGGVQVWGARTIASDPEWRYVPVRRLGDAIGESIRAGTAWCVGEPNDETVWARLRLEVGDFLTELYLAGWFNGNSPSQAFFVRCDLTTMTEQDLAEGRTVIAVGFAPLQPAEFVVLRIVHQRPHDTAVTPAGRLALRFPSPDPNPANPRTTLRFTLSDAAHTRLDLFDLGGRLVRVLVADEVLAAGDHTRGWDGRDGNGNAVGSGVYLVRLEAGGLTRVQRVTMVR